MFVDKRCHESSERSWRRFFALLAVLSGVVAGLPQHVWSQGFELFDDFSDGSFLDHTPVDWDSEETRTHPFHEMTEEGVRLWNNGSFVAALATRRWFDGDVSVRSRLRVIGGGKGFGHYSRFSLHSHSAYFAVARLNGEIFIERREHGLDLRLATVWVDPLEPGRDYLAQLDLIGEAEFEFRVWLADEPMPVEPTLTAEDERPLPPASVAVAYNDDLPANNGVTRYAVVQWVWIRDSEIGADEIPPPERVTAEFIRGDCNEDGEVNLSDASCVLNWLFAGAAEPGCLSAVDTNGDADLNIADPVFLLNFLFAGGPRLSAPFPDCGPDTGADPQLGCASPPDCR